MPNCAVFGCKNTNKNTKGTGIKYYAFTKNDNLAAIWLQACYRKDRVNLEHARIRTLHFDEDSFFTTLKHKLLRYCPRTFRDLKPDAVPKLNLPGQQIESSGSDQSTENNAGVLKRLEEVNAVKQVNIWETMR